MPNNSFIKFDTDEWLAWEIRLRLKIDFLINLSVADKSDARWKTLKILSVKLKMNIIQLPNKVKLLQATKPFYSFILRKIFSDAKIY